LEILKNAFSFFSHQISLISVFDIIDIAVVSVIFYYLFKFISDRRAGKLAIGILIIVAALFLSDIFNMHTLNFLLENVVQVGLIGLLIVFQTELRTFLEKVGGSSIIGSLNKKTSGDMQKTMQCIDGVVESCVSFSENKTGALIVFERTTQLGEIINTGTVIDAESSVSIINNIFFPKSPLHDGAMIIREGRIYAAACILPLTQRQDISAQLGTRHRAAIGMTENSDAVVLVVSEETGIISIVSNGQITRNYSAVSAEAELMSILVESDQNKKGNNVKQIINKILPNKKSGKDEGNDETA